jgi:hypothetical protein
MIAASIVFTWLALTAAAFLTLSALGRVADRHDFEAQLGVLASGDAAGFQGSVPQPGAQAARTRMSGYMRSSWRPSRRPTDAGLELSRSRSAT